MRFALVVLVVSVAGPVQAFERLVARDSELGRPRAGAPPDLSLGGDVSRPAPSVTAPVGIDAFQRGLAAQVDRKRGEQIAALKEILESNPPDRAVVLFRLGELYWEEAKSLRSAESPDRGQAMAKLAVETYSEIVQRHPSFERTDEVLYFLGQSLTEQGDERKALVAFKRLIEKYPGSKFVPDAHLAFGEFYFNGSKAHRELLERALGEYQLAAKDPKSAVAAYALYKQGWCHFNLGEYEKAMAVYRAVVLLEGNRQAMASEARNNFVRSYSRLPEGTPGNARERFSALAKTPEDLRLMNKQLAGLYYADGKDKEAAVAFDLLIKDAPTSPEAPGFQSKIIDCVMRAGNKRMTVQQVHRLVKLVAGQPPAIDRDELAERVLSRLAVTWHNECRSTRDDETCALTSEIYADYLTLFPDGPKAYELRFFWAELLHDNLGQYARAGEQYSAVFTADILKGAGCKVPGEVPCKRMVSAGYNAILAFDAAARGVARPTITDPAKPLEQPSEIRSLQGACDRYLKYLPNGEKWVDVEWKSAKTSYDYNDLERAIPRFADIALNHCDQKFSNDERAGELARHLVLDSFNLQGDCRKVSEWARKFLAQEQCVTGGAREELATVLEQSEFTCIGKLGAREDCKVAEAWSDFVYEFPRSQIADKALFNAGAEFFKCQHRERAMESWKLLLHGYPKSAYVPKATFALGEAYEAVADFDAAAAHYEQYAAQFEKPRFKQVWEESQAKLALFNAGVLREGLGAFRAAVADREKYLQLWPDTKDSEQVFLSIADLEERAGYWARAIGQLEEFEKKFAAADPNKLLATEGRIASLYEVKLKNPKAARKVQDRILATHQRLPKQLPLEPRALDAVARAHLARGEDGWKKYTRLKLHWSKLSNVGELRASIAQKARALEDLQRTYTTTVSFKSAEPAVCALYKIGAAYDDFSEAMSHLPVPSDASAAMREELRRQLPQETGQLKERAAEALTAAVTKSDEFAIDNPCRTAALELLRSHYQLERFPKMGEDVPPLKLEPGPGPAVGEGLLRKIEL